MRREEIKDAGNKEIICGPEEWKRDMRIGKSKANRKDFQAAGDILDI